MLVCRSASIFVLPHYQVRVMFFSPDSFAFRNEIPLLLETQIAFAVGVI